MQRNLEFVDLPEPVERLWDQLDEPLRQAVLDRLAQALAKVAVANINLPQEKSHD